MSTGKHMCRELGMLLLNTGKIIVSHLQMLILTGHKRRLKVPAGYFM